MAYPTLAGTRRKLKESMWDLSNIDSIITATFADVDPIINSVIGNTTDFTELELTTTKKDIRVASDCYCAYRIMSEELEGVDVTIRALALVRRDEAWNLLKMYCANNGIIPSFDIVPADGGVIGREVIDYAYGCGTDENCIG